MNYKEYIFFGILFIISLILTYLIRILAIKKAILDIPNERSSHTIPTPRGGGIAIAISWFIGITYLYIVNLLESDLFFAMLSGLILVVVGVIDDIRDVSPKIRMIFQSLSAILALYFLSGFHKIDLGFYIFEQKWILSVIGFFAIIWFTNLFNFLDGIDGYASSQAFFFAIALYVFTGSEVLLVFAVSVLGFIPWNWQKAKIFMGDVGSTLLGFNVIILSIYFQNTGEISIILTLILSSLFWFDASYTLFKRWRNKEKLSQAHNKHAFQLYVRAGNSHQKTVLSGMLINVLMFVGVYYFYSHSKYILLVFAITLVFLFLTYHYVSKKIM